MKILPLSIDIPFLYHYGGHRWSREETMLLTDLLSDISKDFTRMQKVIYTDESFSQYITSVPILTDVDLGERINHDIMTSLGKMHEMGRHDETLMFVVPSSRWPEDCRRVSWHGCYHKA